MKDKYVHSDGDSGGRDETVPSENGGKERSLTTGPHPGERESLVRGGGRRERVQGYGVFGDGGSGDLF